MRMNPLWWLLFGGGFDGHGGFGFRHLCYSLGRMVLVMMGATVSVTIAQSLQGFFYRAVEDQRFRTLLQSKATLLVNRDQTGFHLKEASLTVHTVVDTNASC